MYLYTYIILNTRPLLSFAIGNSINTVRINDGGYESFIGNTPLVYLPNISSLLSPNNGNNGNLSKIYVKMESMNPGGTGKDRAARSMILDAEARGELPMPHAHADVHPLKAVTGPAIIDIHAGKDIDGSLNENDLKKSHVDGPDTSSSSKSNVSSSSNINTISNIPANIHKAILTALHATQTHGVLIEGTSGSTGISLASLSCSRGHGVIVVMPDDQSKQKVEYLEKLGVGVVVVKNCSISNPGHYVNVAKRIWEWLQKERRYDAYYAENVVISGSIDIGKEHEQSLNLNQQPLIQAAFMNQFENIANVNSHYRTTGPEIYSQLNGKVDAFVMSAGTGGTLVGVGGYLKEKWWQNQQNGNGSSLSSSPPRIVLIDPPGSSLHNKIKYGVAYTRQQSEQSLRRHRYDTLAEGIGLDRITANFGLGCEDIVWSDKNAFGNQINELLNSTGTNANHGHTNNQHHSHLDQSKIIDDSYSITDQQAIYMAHYLLRHEGLFVGSSTAMNLVGALKAASTMPSGSNVVTVVCDGGHRHTSRFWNRDFVVNEWGLVWPGEEEDEVSILDILGIEAK